jgi:hypothetical protein
VTWTCTNGTVQIWGTPVCQANANGSPTIVNLSSGTYTATSASEEFRFDFQLVRGRATTANDLAVTIIGFDVTKDRLVFVNVTDQTLYTEAQFKALAGVAISEGPYFDPSTTIAFDANQNSQVGSVTVQGIADAALSQIVVETTVRPSLATAVRREAATK